ncbi:hypothetical protein CVV68_12425 [Arthrobacter livingstonensis]|uniref:Uncharacterized protein n=1 Tax=Arthrobacter livingstonensis TaxID=670078 RepID=A0A2V5L905_9MICC|nr:hypothetical protein [Arthrobacter livingstonensis]PYI66894.1 hypothetical protein CVV68_12425 [Arthrobacter livingstonensis]
MVYFSKFRSWGIRLVASFVGVSLLLTFGFGNRGNAVVWGAAIVAIIAILVLVLLRHRGTRISATLFLLAGISGAVFASGAGLGWPAALPLWLWIATALGLATVGIVEDADTTQTRSTSRL